MLALLASLGGERCRASRLDRDLRRPRATSPRCRTNADRLLVVEQGGTIQLVDHGVASTFLDLTNAADGERRRRARTALGRAGPDYATSHHLYVYFTHTGGSLEVDEFTADGDSVPLSTRRPLLAIPHPKVANHNGGQLQFGPDGNLYICTGDGGGAGDSTATLRTSARCSGKILRIDPHPSGALPYTIPPGNPFVGRARPEIWAYGLRNPWRFSFDRLTGALLIGDVGQGAREEVDYRTQPDPARGENFGWNCREGLIAYTAPGTACDRSPRPASSTRSTTTATMAGAARSSAVTSSATRASATSTAATCSATTATGRFAPWCPASRSRPAPGPRGSASAGRRASARTPAAASTSARWAAGTVSRLEGDAPAAVPPRAAATATDTAPLRWRAGDQGRGARRLDQGLAGRRRDRRRLPQQQDPVRRRRRSDLRARRPRPDQGGRRGDDRIRGGHGKDICKGGPGRDRTRSC